MIQIIHGSDYNKSYKRLQEIVDNYKRKSYEITEIDNKKQEAISLLRKKSLFNDKLLFIIKADRLSKKEILEINNNSREIDIIIYADNEIAANILKEIQNIRNIDKFNIPKLIWVFLDSIYPGNVKNILIMLNKVLETETIELIFQLLSQRFRDLIWINEGSKDIGYEMWRITKLKSQARKYSNNQIKDILKSLAELDIRCKTTNSELKEELDFLFIKHLELNT